MSEAQAVADVEAAAVLVGAVEVLDRLGLGGPELADRHGLAGVRVHDPQRQLAVPDLAEGDLVDVAVRAEDERYHRFTSAPVSARAIAASAAERGAGGRAGTLAMSNGSGSSPVR